MNSQASGDYTAAAVASIAFDLPHAVLDGNVLRVLARLTNDSGEITSSQTRTRLRQEADRLLDRRAPGVFNQAMMELGAMVCVPERPCAATVRSPRGCLAFREGTAAGLPVKLRKKEPVEIEAAVAIVRRNRSLLLWRRGPDEGRMAGFWELPEPAQLPGLRQGKIIGTFRHSITHHRYTFAVRYGNVSHVPAGFDWVAHERWANCR